MAQLPYMISASAVKKILEKIKEAPTPSKFTQNYLSTTLGFEGANDKAFISYAKSLDFIDAAGVPTSLYKQFRTPSLSGGALAKGLMQAYKPLYDRNERFYELSKAKFHELVCAETGLDHDNVTAKRITNTFLEAKKQADFTAIDGADDDSDYEETVGTDEQNQSEELPQTITQHHVGKLGLSYNINLILPNTDDPKVFNAIFKSLKENLL
ncbi:MAG: DUF5343 domain-containing protein [Marinobacter sp.]|jgi:hypothetical protein|nr:DUF5343 domain-containing protein [Marinobacter sp.]